MTKVVNGQVQVVSRHDFTPFGEEVNPPNPPIDKRLFTGQERDFETGLDYFNARYQAASYGRFTTVDPLGREPSSLGDPQGYNRYAYGANNPLRFVDPQGLTPFDVDGLGPTFLPWLFTPVTTFYSSNDRGRTGWFESGGAEFEGTPDRSMVALSEGVASIAGAALPYIQGASAVIGAAAVATSGVPLVATILGRGVLTTLNLAGAAQAAALTLPPGAKLAQMIARGGGVFAGNPTGFLSFARDFITTAARQGSYVFASWIDETGATIYRVGNEYMVVARNGTILSYVTGADSSRGIVTTYAQLGGK